MASILHTVSTVQSINDLLFIIDNLQEKKEPFISIKENIDTTTPQGKLLLNIFAGLAHYERECTRHRQSRGQVQRSQAISKPQPTGTYKSNDI